MQIIIEKIENGFLVVVQDAKGRRVWAAPLGSDVVSFVKDAVDPSPIQVPDKTLTTVKLEPKV